MAEREGRPERERGCSAERVRNRRTAPSVSSAYGGAHSSRAQSQQHQPQQQQQQRRRKRHSTAGGGASSQPHHSQYSLQLHNMAPSQHSAAPAPMIWPSGGGGGGGGNNHQHTPHKEAQRKSRDKNR